MGFHVHKCKAMVLKKGFKEDKDVKFSIKQVP